MVLVHARRGGFLGTDFEEANLYEVTDGKGRFWLARECDLHRHDPGPLTHL